MAERILNKSPSPADDVEEKYGPIKEEEVSPSYKRSQFDKLLFLECAALLALIADLLSSLIAWPLKKRFIWGLESCKWFFMALLVFCERMISGWIIRVGVLVIERNFILRKRVLYFVYGVRSSAKNCLWFGLVLLVWNLVLEKKGRHKEKGGSNEMNIEQLQKLNQRNVSAWKMKRWIRMIRSSGFANTIERSLNYHEHDSKIDIERQAAITAKRIFENVAKHGTDYIKSNHHHWYPEYNLFTKEIENTNRMRMGLCLRHTMNYQNICERSNRRSALLLKMKDMLEELQIEYQILPEETPVKFVGSTAR